MGRVVEAPRVVVDADRVQDGAHEGALAGLGERARAVAQQRAVDRRCRGHQRDETVAQARQRLGQLVGVQAGLVVVEERVVGVVRLGEAGAVAPAQLDLALQVRGERREVAVLARLQPGHPRRRRRARELGDELARHPARLVVVAARYPHDVGLELVARLRGLEQLAHALVDETLVRDAPHGGPHLAAPFGAGGRHADLLIPAQHSHRLLEVGDLGKALAQLVHPPEASAMARDNIATVQEIYAAFGRGDIPAILDRLAEDIDWEPDPPVDVRRRGPRVLLPPRRRHRQTHRGGAIARRRLARQVAHAARDVARELRHFEQNRGLAARVIAPRRRPVLGADVVGEHRLRPRRQAQVSLGRVLEIALGGARLHELRARDVDQRPVVARGAAVVGDPQRQLRARDRAAAIDDEEIARLAAARPRRQRR
jgi:ketosteroid isomerase-like protein